MAAQCTPDRLLTSLRVTFAEDITTTHLIPVPNEDEKAALYYTRRDLQIFKLTNKLRTQRKIVILMKLIADRNAQDALNERKEENIQGIQFQTTESFYNARGSALPVEDLAWKRTCCTKTKDWDATSTPVMLPETPGSRLDGDLLGMANTNTHEDNVKAMEFQNSLEEMTWKRTCCTKIKDCDAISAPVMLPETRGSQLNDDQLGVANTNTQEEKAKAMEFQKIKSFYIGGPRATPEDRTCPDFKDCDTTTILSKARISQLSGDCIIGITNTNPQEENEEAMELQKIIYIGAPRATQDEQTCSDLKGCDVKAILLETRDSNLDTEQLAVTG